MVTTDTRHTLRIDVSHKQGVHLHNSDTEEWLERIATAISEFRKYANPRMGVRSAIEQVCANVRDGITRADMASITLITKGVPKSVAGTERAVLEIDDAQYRAMQGPCLEAARKQTTVCVDADEIAVRWPCFSRAVAERRPRNCLSLSLQVGVEDRGSLNLYSWSGERFSSVDIAAAHVYVSAAESLLLALYHAERAQRDVEGLRRAIESRSTIEQAKGIVMAAFGASPEKAFELLKWRSQQNNVKLRDLCEQFVADVCEQQPVGAEAGDRVGEILVTCHTRVTNRAAAG